MAAKWYYQKDGNEVGPVSGEDLQRLVAARQLTSDDLIRRDGMENWVPASKVAGLLRPVKPKPPIASQRSSEPQSIETQDHLSTSQDEPTIGELAKAVGTIAAEKVQGTANQAVSILTSEQTKEKIEKVTSFGKRILSWLSDLIRRFLAWFLAFLTRSSKISTLKHILDKEWFVSSNAKTTGPFTLDAILEQWNKGIVNDDTLVFIEGDEHWTPLKGYESLHDLREHIKEQRRDRFRLSIAAAAIAVCAAVLYLPAQSVSHISSVQDDKLIGESLGFVVCGLSVILPNGEQKEFPQSTGTSFAVSPSGHMLTNAHVVKSTNNFRKSPLIQTFKNKGFDVKPTVWVFLNGEKYIAEVEHISDSYDLAVLKLDHRFLHPFRLSESDTVSRGTDVFALGFPGAARSALSTEEMLEDVRRENAEDSVNKAFKPRDFEFILTTGSVSRSTEESEGRKWIQHNADINPGNSGGPLTTNDGTVVGINTLGQREASGVFFSLSTDQLRKEIESYTNGVQWK